MKFYIVREEPGKPFRYLYDIPYPNSAKTKLVWSLTFNDNCLPFTTLNNAIQIRDGIETRHNIDSSLIYHIVDQDNNLIG